jgi:hypothetical protein
LRTSVSSGTPYWSAIEIEVANAFIMPRSVEPSLPMSVRKISPTVPSSYMPAVM